MNNHNLRVGRCSFDQQGYTSAGNRQLEAPVFSIVEGGNDLYFLFIGLAASHGQFPSRKTVIPPKPLKTWSYTSRLEGNKNAEDKKCCASALPVGAMILGLRKSDTRFPRPAIGAGHASVAWLSTRIIKHDRDHHSQNIQSQLFANSTE